MLWIETKYLRLVSSRLRNFKQKKESLYNFSCPFCGDSHRNALKARGYIVEHKGSYVYKCWNCGFATSFSHFLKHLDQDLHREYVMERFRDRNKQRQDRPKIEAPSMTPPPKIPDMVSITKLSADHFAAKYVADRKIPEERRKDLYYCDDFKAFLDKIMPEGGKNLDDHDKRLVWFLSNLNQDVTHICGRTLANSTIRYIKRRVYGGENDRKVFGLKYIDITKPIYIVEGEIDSMFLKNGIAPGDSSLDSLAAALLVHYQGHPIKVVLVYDNEPRNKEIVKQQHKAIEQGHNVVIWPKSLEGLKDINEMVLAGVDLEMVQAHIEQNTFSGPRAHLMFNQWSKW